MSGKTVLLLGSFAPSLVHFRGPLIAAIIERGHRVVAAAPSISADVVEKLRQLGAEPRELQLVNASLNPASMLQSLRKVRALIREVRPDVLIAYTAGATTRHSGQVSIRGEGHGRARFVS
jgi:hypothetical protein